MAGTTWEGGRAITVTIPVAIAGSKLISRWTCADGSCPALNVSRCPPPAARVQPWVAGGAPLDGSGGPPRFGGPAGTYCENPPSCHAAQGGTVAERLAERAAGRSGHREGLDGQAGDRGRLRVRRVVRRQEIGQREPEQPQRVAGLPRT